MKQLMTKAKAALMFIVMGLFTMNLAWAEADSTITTAISGDITNAGDTAKAVVILLIGASVVVMAALWAWGMVRKGRNG